MTSETRSDQVGKEGPGSTSSAWDRHDLVVKWIRTGLNDVGPTSGNRLDFPPIVSKAVTEYHIPGDSPAGGVNSQEKCCGGTVTQGIVAKCIELMSCDFDIAAQLR